ncbi:MAG: ABC transporter substrate-binding protein [Paracoccaceae bacterium]
MSRIRSGASAIALSFALLGGVSAQALADPAGRINVALGAESTTMDPAKYSAGVDQYFIGTMFEMLVKPMPDGSTENWLAESWSIDNSDPEKPVIDVHIRPGVTFHNGDPLTSADFEFSYQRQADPNVSRWSHFQANIEQFEIVDDLHFRLHFKQPDSSYVANYLQLWAMPKNYFEQVGDEEFGRNPVGTGPWKFVSRTPKEELMLEAYDGYWNKDHRPAAAELRIRIIPEDLTRVAALQTGEVDWIDAVPPAMLKDVKAMPGVATATMPSGNNLFLDMDTIPEGPLQNVKVRQAIAHGIDMDAIIDSVLFGQGQRYAEVAEGATGYNPDLKPFDYDPALATKLLAEAGYPGGFDVDCYNLITPREPNMKEMGEAMFAYLGTIGVRCKVVSLEYGAWINLGRRDEKTEQLNGGLISWMWGQGIPGDPAVPWGGHLHSYEPGKGWGSYSHANDPEFDRMIEEATRIMDPDARAAALRAIAARKHEMVLGGLTTYLPLVTMAWNGDKVDYTPWPYPGFWRNFQEIGLKN